MSKRIIALLLALVMVFALCACGNGGNGGNGGNSAGTEDVGHPHRMRKLRLLPRNSRSVSDGEVR